MHRGPACAALLAFACCACQETKITDPTLITGGGPVAVLTSSYVAAGDSAPMLGAGPVMYVVSTVELHNEQSTPLYPVIAHFSLIDRSGNRYFGSDSGSLAFAGVHNDVSPLGPDRSRTFVVAFRAGATTMGTIRYDY